LKRPRASLQDMCGSVFKIYIGTIACGYAPAVSVVLLLGNNARITIR
jgi:hypothetical protein